MFTFLECNNHKNININLFTATALKMFPIENAYDVDTDIRQTCRNMGLLVWKLEWNTETVTLKYICSFPLWCKL